jgi:hypothetical protein
MSSNVNAMKNASKSPKKILLIIAGIILLVFLYYTIQSYRTYKSSSPFLVVDTIEGSSQKRIEANRIADPTDGKYGQEFTYCTWLYIKDTNFIKTSDSDNQECNIDNSGSPLFRMIFNKGSDDLKKIQQQIKQPDGTMKTVSIWHYPTLSCPGVFLYPNTNKLHIRFNTFEKGSIYKSADVGNIPLNKWFMLTIVLIGNSVDIYINNMLKKREVVGVVKMNYGDLHIGSYGGFDGYLSNFRYFNRSVQSWEIDEMYQVGVGTEMRQPVANIQQVANLSPNYFFTTGFANSNFMKTNQ